MIAQQVRKEIENFKFSYTETQYKKSKERKLFELGFKFHPSTKEVKKEIENNLKQKLKKELYDDFMLFSVKYPNHILILESEIEKIKEKYGLEFEGATYFIGDIPEKNLQDILSFSYDGNFNIRILGTKNQFINSNIGGEKDPVIFLRLTHRKVEEIVNKEVFRESDSLYVLITMWGDEENIPEFNVKNN